MERKSLKKPSVSTAFNEYIADKEHTVVPSTLDAYIIAFQVFCSEVGVMGDEPVTVLSKNLVEQWKSVRLSSSSSMATSNQYLNAFRTFLYWCMSRDYLDNYTVKLFRNVKCMSLKRYRRSVRNFGKNWIPTATSADVSAPASGSRPGNFPASDRIRNRKYDRKNMIYYSFVNCEHQEESANERERKDHH